MKNALFFLLAFLSAGLQAQDGHFGIAANFGFSRTGTLLSEVGTFDNPWAFSGHGGLYWEKKAGPSFRAGAALLFAQIEGNEVRKGEELRFAVPDPEFPPGSRFDSETLYHYSYLALRPYAQLLLKSFDFGLGIQPMWLLASSYEERQKIYRPGLPDKILERKDGSFQNVSKLDIAPVLTVGFQLNRRFRLQATYFRGLVHILKDAEGSDTVHQQATLGLSFCLACAGKKVVKGLGG